MKRVSAAIVLMMLLVAFPALAQQPKFSVVSDVLIGSQRLETREALAIGRWSDAHNDAAIDSTEIRCWERFGFYTVASAFSSDGKVWVNLNVNFDILRWDSRELVAEYELPCLVNTLRFDFEKYKTATIARKVSLSSTLKSGVKDIQCDKVQPVTKFLAGRGEVD